MTKYVVVSKCPENLDKGEYVIEMPTFVEEVRECSGKRPIRKFTAVNFLRAVAGVIGQKYDPDHFNPYTNVIPNLFEGRRYETDEDLAKVVYEMFQTQYPVIFTKIVDTKIKQRPFGTKLIYFVGDHLYTAPFASNGIDSINKKDVDAYMGRKHKKQVDKSATPDEELVDQSEAAQQ